MFSIHGPHYSFGQTGVFMYCHFLSGWTISSAITYSTVLLVTNSFNFDLSVKSFPSPSFWKDIFIGQRIIGWKCFCFFLTFLFAFLSFYKDVREWSFFLILNLSVFSVCIYAFHVTSGFWKCDFDELVYGFLWVSCLCIAEFLISIEVYNFHYVCKVSLVSSNTTFFGHS